MPPHQRYLRDAPILCSLLLYEAAIDSIDCRCNILLMYSIHLKFNMFYHIITRMVVIGNEGVVEEEWQK